MNIFMKKMVALLLGSALSIGFFSACGGKEDNTETTAATVTSEDSSVFTPVGKEGLNGKKVIFFGNSHTYFGKCVIEKGQTVYGQDERINDQGFFYQICKANGIDVNVCNFTFGGHQISDFTSGSCAADRGHDGLNHLQYMSDFDYDYVIIQEGSSGSTGDCDIVREVKTIMELFKDKQDVKYVYLVQLRAHTDNYVWLPQLKQLEEFGVLVVDWGRIPYDIMEGKVAVPGATEEYNKNSFIISKSEEDGFHPNVLTGYITALATYCAITGEKAEGQTYDFGESNILTGTSALVNFRAKYYIYNPLTNFDTILKSKSDMTGIQKLIDQYLAAKDYRNY